MLNDLLDGLESENLPMVDADVKFWRHGINTGKHACGPRINFTFRSVTARGRSNPVRCKVSMSSCKAKNLPKTATGE